MSIKWHSMAGKLRPFFSFYGGKYRAAKLYRPPVFGRPVIEPFAGGAGYSVYWGCRKVKLYDVDEAVCGVWDYLIRAKESEISALPDMRPGGSAAELPITQEARWLIGFWCNVASAVPKPRLSAWACKATSQLMWGERVRRRLVAQLHHIREWTIEQRSFAEIPDQWATWFIDPPYQGKPGRSYRHNVVDYAALAAYCQTRSGRVIVCENHGADWLPFAHLAHTKAGGGSKGARRTSHEVVWSPDIPGPRAL